MRQLRQSPKTLSAGIHNRYQRTKTVWAPALGFLCLLFGAVEAFARSGGGQNYGGGQNTGSGMGDSEGGNFVFVLIGAVLENPIIGIPLVIVILAGVALYKYKWLPKYQENQRLADMERAVQDPPSSEGATYAATSRTDKSVKKTVSAGVNLSGIKERDPEFDENQFIERVKVVENKVQGAWLDRKVAPIRTFLSDGLFRRFETQLHIMQHQSVKNIMIDHEITQAYIHAVDQDEHFDTVHVAFHGTGRDIDVDADMPDDQAERKAKSAPKTSYIEIWSFLRRPGAKTLSQGSVEMRCPSCGVDLPVGQATRCEHCQALLNSGEYDWVLAEITQADEWTSDSSGEVPGLMRLSTSDPTFSRQVAEDRATYLFWRWIEAFETGSIAPLSKVGAPNFKKLFQGQIERPQSQYKAALASSDLFRCETDVQGQDRYFVRLKWSAALSKDGDPTRHSHVMLVTRKHGVQSKEANGLSFAHCPNCNGPLTENDDAKCGFCDAVLGDPDKDWVISSVIDSNHFNENNLSNEGVDMPALPAMTREEETSAVYQAAAMVALADGKFTDAEKTAINMAVANGHFTQEFINKLFAGTIDFGYINQKSPENPQRFFDKVLMQAFSFARHELSDHSIGDAEKKMLFQIAQKVGLKREQAGAIIEHKRKQEMAFEQKAVDWDEAFKNRVQDDLPKMSFYDRHIVIAKLKALILREEGLTPDRIQKELASDIKILEKLSQQETTGKNVISTEKAKSIVEGKFDLSELDTKRVDDPNDIVRFVVGTAAILSPSDDYSYTINERSRELLIQAGLKMGVPWYQMDKLITEEILDVQKEYAYDLYLKNTGQL